MYQLLNHRPVTELWNNIYFFYTILLPVFSNVEVEMIYKEPYFVLYGV